MTTPSPPPSPRFLTVQKVADLYQVSVWFVRTEIHANRLPARWFAGGYRVKAEDAARWANGDSGNRQGGEEDGKQGGTR